MKPFPICIVTEKYSLDSCYCLRVPDSEIPRILFDGASCFTRMCSHNLHKSKVYEHLAYSEPFVIPGLPDRIELTKTQLPASFNPEYVKAYQEATGSKVWYIGSVSLCNKESLDKAERGRIPSIDENQ
ncbi:hypothetical protein CRYUN_Cryun08bG0135400 [Craigia yunnanensis]